MLTFVLEKLVLHYRAKIHWENINDWVSCPGFQDNVHNTDAKKELKSSGLNRRLSLESLFVYRLEQRVLGSAVWAGKGNSDDIASVKLLWRGSEHEASHWLSDKKKTLSSNSGPDDIWFLVAWLRFEVREEDRIFALKSKTSWDPFVPALAAPLAGFQLFICWNCQPVHSVWNYLFKLDPANASHFCKHKDAETWPQWLKDIKTVIYGKVFLF